MERTILLVSPDGMLGRAFVERLSEGLPSGYDAWRGVTFPEFDLREVASIARAVVPGVRLVINCAAYTDVDAAESNEAQAGEVNGHGVRRLADRCREIGATLLHFGTDYVFDGRADTPYRVDAPLAPQGAYGRSKALGETLLRQSGAEHLHVRTSWLYAPWSKNFVRTIAALAAQRPRLQVVADQRGRPTSAEHLARTSIALLEGGARGTWHVTDGGECTWFDLASEVVRLAEAPCEVVPCTSAEFPRPAPRPAYSVLDLTETEARVGPMPPWRQNLADVMGRRV